MDASALAENWRLGSYRLFRYRYDLAVPLKLVFALGMACFTGLCAQIRIPHPFTDVPITGQVFAVLLSGVLLGKSYGAASQLIYVGIGAAGMPWFAGPGAGLAALSGSSSGYLIGFIPAAALVGWFTDRRIRLRGIWGQALLMMAAVAIVYLFGAFQYAMVMRTGLWVTLMRTVVWFVPVDFAKALALNALIWRSCPRFPTMEK